MLPGLQSLGFGSVKGLLGGSWVVISGVISPLTWVRSIVTRLTTLLITTHEPPSNAWLRARVLGCRGLEKGLIQIMLD